MFDHRHNKTKYIGLKQKAIKIVLDSDGFSDFYSLFTAYQVLTKMSSRLHRSCS